MQSLTVFSLFWFGEVHLQDSGLWVFWSLLGHLNLGLITLEFNLTCQNVDDWKYEDEDDWVLCADRDHGAEVYEN